MFPFAEDVGGIFRLGLSNDAWQSRPAGEKQLRLSPLSG